MSDGYARMFGVRLRIVAGKDRWDHEKGFLGRFALMPKGVFRGEQVEFETIMPVPVQKLKTENGLAEKRSSVALHADTCDAVRRT